MRRKQRKRRRQRAPRQQEQRRPQGQTLLQEMMDPFWSWRFMRRSSERPQ